MKHVPCLLGFALLCAAAVALGEEVAPVFPVPAAPSFLDSIPWDVFERGGPVMWAVLLAAVIGLGFAIERFIGLRRRKNIPHEFHKDVVHVVDTRGVDAGLSLCTQKPSSTSRVLHAALLRYGAGRKDMEQAVSDEGRRVHYDLCRRTRVIGRMSALAPLLGLLGTCVGLMDCCDLSTPVTNALTPLAFGLGTGIVLLYL
ncbi:MAG: MotA/TolQ/ExbB proton channel family protein, partial [Planctomycetota bacterium]|nr:MotA/TolQ/ExbB proton channel family protein [Planctomycetota bacterium]